MKFYRKFDTCDPRDRAIKVPIWNKFTLKECVIVKKESTCAVHCLILIKTDSKVIFFFSQQGTTKVVFAYHTEDPKSGDEIAPHTFFGSRSILLLNKMDERQVNETGWKDFLMHNKNVRCLEFIG